MPTNGTTIRTQLNPIKKLRETEMAEKNMAVRLNGIRNCFSKSNQSFELIWFPLMLELKIFMLSYVLLKFIKRQVVLFIQYVCHTEIKKPVNEVTKIRV